MKTNLDLPCLRFIHLTFVLVLSVLLTACDTGLTQPTLDEPESSTELTRMDMQTPLSNQAMASFSNPAQEAVKSSGSTAASKTYGFHFYLGALGAYGETKTIRFADPNNPDVDASLPYAGQHIEMTVRDDRTLTIPRSEFALSTVVHGTNDLRMNLHPVSDLQGSYAYSASQHEYRGQLLYRGDVAFEGTYLFRNVSAPGQTCRFEDVEVELNITFTTDSNEAWSSLLDDVHASAYVNMVSNGFGLDRPTGCEPWVYRQLADYEDVAAQESAVFGFWMNAREAFLPPGVDPLTASISGPTRLDYLEQGTWIANVNGGTEPYRYQWQSCVLIPGMSCSWQAIGGNSSTLTMPLAHDTKLKVVATDAHGDAQSAYLNVNVDGGDFDDFDTAPRRR